MTDRVLTCTSFDTATATCTAEAWVEPASPIPDITEAQGAEIAYAICLLWVLAWCLRYLRRFAEQQN